MNESEIRAVVLRELRAIAPEVPAEQIRPADDLREQLDLDSMDVVNLMAALEDRLGVHIAETDHKRMASLDAAVAYLAAALQHGAPGATEPNRQ